MSNPLVEFWDGALASEPPYTHPLDQKHLEHLSQRLSEVGCHDFESFIRSEYFGLANSTAYHTGLLPMPYTGDLARAKIHLLLLNPGFRPLDY
jgi:hypothetical protein